MARKRFDRNQGRPVVRYGAGRPGRRSEAVAGTSLYSYIGMFMLIGIVKKNGIMMVDFAVEQRRAGKTPVEAGHEASIERFRPIIMTTLSALMGAIPIALGLGADGESRRPLGLILVGGLIVSQLITLYVTPALYLYMESLQENLNKLYGKMAGSRRSKDPGIGHHTGVSTP